MCLTPEKLLMVLVALFVSCVILGAIVFWRRLKEPRNEEEEQGYDKQVVLAYCSFSFTGLVFFIGLGYGNLGDFLSPIFFLATAFVAFTLCLLVRNRAVRLSYYLSDEMMNIGLLAFVSGVLVFFWQHLSPVTIIFVILIVILFILFFEDLYSYLRSLKPKESHQNNRRKKSGSKRRNREKKSPSRT